MQSGLRWSGLVSRRRYPVAGAPYAPAPVSLVVCGHLVFSQALRAGVLVSGLRPGILSVPPPLRPTLCARSSLTSRLPGPSLSPPPKGAGPVPCSQAAGTGSKVIGRAAPCPVPHSNTNFA